MKERPILFKPEMIKAILNGNKTMTRRVVKFPKHAYKPDINWIKSIHQDGGGNWVAWSTNEQQLIEFTKKAYPSGEGFKCPYGKISDKFWVKETWSTFPPYDNRPTIACSQILPYVIHKESGFYEKVIHKAGKENYAWGMYGEPKWKSSLFMPKTATRIWLKIIDIRIERLQDITIHDCLHEGIEINPDNLFSPITKLSIDTSFQLLNKFEILWDSINKKEPYRWRDNPFVWVIDFKKL